MHSRRVSSGIKNMDPLLNGGFPEKSIITYHGAPGTGKTICSLFFLYDGLKKGEKVLYITFEEGSENILKLAKTLGIDFETYLENRSLIIKDFSKLISDKGLNESITHNIKTSNIRRIAIDSLTTAIIDNVRSDNSLTLKKFIRNFLRNLREANVISIVISRDELEYETIVGLCDCAVYFQSHTMGTQGLSSCVITKVRLSKHNRNLQYLDISKKGEVSIRIEK